MIHIIEIISLVIMTLSLIGIFIWCIGDFDIIIFKTCCIIGSISFLIGLCTSLFDEKTPMKFPSSKYILELEITQHPFYSDTTYVLTKVK